MRDVAHQTMIARRSASEAASTRPRLVAETNKRSDTANLRLAAQIECAPNAHDRRFACAELESTRAAYAATEGDGHRTERSRPDEKVDRPVAGAEIDRQVLRPMRPYRIRVDGDVVDEAGDHALAEEARAAGEHKAGTIDRPNGPSPAGSPDPVP